MAAASRVSLTKTLRPWGGDRCQEILLERFLLGTPWRQSSGSWGPGRGEWRSLELPGSLCLEVSLQKDLSLEPLQRVYKFELSVCDSQSRGPSNPFFRSTFSLIPSLMSDVLNFTREFD